MGGPHSLLAMHVSAERQTPQLCLVLRKKPPKSQHVVIFQATEISQLPFIHHRVKTHKELPCSRQRVRTHNVFPFIPLRMKTHKELHLFVEKPRT